MEFETNASDSKRDVEEDEHCVGSDIPLVEETLSNSDNLEVESGVESATGDVLDAELLDLACFAYGNEDIDLADLDLTTEQVQETLKYFTLASNRTNQMTKTHNDLDAILQLLQEKEKDLELAAKIGQSLLERNKQLLAKTEAFEEFVTECGEKETQLQYEVTMKNELLHKFMKDRELDDFYTATQRTDEDSNSGGSTSESSCRDDSINTLRQKCQTLEEQNSSLILEALQLKEETASVEMKEQQLVLDCVKQLVSAKDQITELTDEISQKAEDNIRQQEEITHLISTVVDLQKRHKQLSVDNEDLQSLLATSQANQNQLKSQVDDLQDKYHECLEMLLENQREVKKLNTRFDCNIRPVKLSPSSSLSHYDSRDSIALEIEESVKRDLTSQQEKRAHTARVMETVRAINTSKGAKQPRFPRAQGFPQGTLTEGAGYHFTPAPGGVGSPEEAAGVRSQPDRRVGTQFGRRSFRAPEKLQIVKPIKGSVTLHKWKKLANPTLNIAESRPGVHVKGEGQEQRGDKEPKEQTDTSDLDPDDYEEDEPLQMRFGRTSESTHFADSDEEDEDGPIHMRATRYSEKSGSPAGTEKAGNAKSGSSSASPSNLGLIPLVSGQGFQRGADSGGILSHLLNSPSSTAPATSSVGQVLADVLQKASEAASDKEPSRAESLRNLANYFSEKERGRSTSPVKVNNPAPAPAVPRTSSPGAGILLSKILGTSGLTIATPVTTTARTNDSVSTTATTSTSTTPSILKRASLVRNTSGSNLLNLAQGSMSDDTALKRFSLDSSRLPKNASKPMDLPASPSSPEMDFSPLSFPTLRRRASSGDLQEFGSSANLDQLGGDGLGARLYRSSSSGNIKDLSGESTTGSSEGGFFGRLRRTPSIGSLTNLVQRSNFSAIPSSVHALRQQSTSLESFPVLKPSGTPPSPSSFDQDGGHFFGRSLSAQNPPSASAETVSGAVGGGFFSGARLSSLAGVSGFWTQGGSKSLDSASPPPLPPPVKEPASEERLEKINKAFTFEDFGGLGLMSFFGGGKSRWTKGDGQ